MNNQYGRLVFYLVGIAAACVILFALRGMAPIINPILLAGVITITALPVPGALTRRGAPGWLALLLTILAVVALLALVIFTVFFSVTRLSARLPVYLSGMATNATQDFGGSLVDATLNFQLGPVFQAVITTVFGLLAQFGMALFIFFFMISAAMALPGATRLGLNPDSPTIGRISGLTRDVRQYMSILTGINFLVGLGNTILLFALGVDFPLLWGLLAWFMGYVPSVGFMIALIPPLLLAYAEFGLSKALIVLVGYVVINGGVQNFIQPKLMGQGLRVNPLVVFVGLFVWVYLLGAFGAILAVPLTLLVLTVLENFEGTRTVSVLLRYTGEEKKEEREEAMSEVRGLWERARRAVAPRE
jgi:predicted PurR-regulated permease PerM